MNEYNWLYVAKRQGKPEFIKAFKRFDPANVEWTANVDEAAEFTESEWRRERAMGFILAERLCLVSYADEPRKARERPTGRHGPPTMSRETFMKTTPTEPKAERAPAEAGASKKQPRKLKG